ncbi:hypothetical protein O7631_18125 [Micromonospora sp. WMMD967]|uniref:hypothetical protein n=1 Tax=Micromonospora sp. WMMD967 TaxID=3016101 RepID=UPI002416D70E|nr:hypothetical protein [Micromonospora sp. WMMD967]MDG4838438.1 hypothetical protein [Micromonospora sp. WMMD967]
MSGDEAWSAAARSIVSDVVGRHLDGDGVLRNGCYDFAAGVAVRHELVWGSYFLTTVLAVLTGRVREHPW